jgi:hypothetical protein
MSNDMILMNPNFDTDRLKALEVLQRLRDESARMGIKLEEITVAVDRVLRSHRVGKDDAVFRNLTVEQVQQILEKRDQEAS